MALFYRLSDGMEHVEKPEDAGESEIAAVLNGEEWKKFQGRGRLPEASSVPWYPEIRNCKAETHRNCLAGTIAAPDRRRLLGGKHCAVFYVNQDGIVLVTDSEAVCSAAEKIAGFRKNQTKGRFFFELLQELTQDHGKLLDHYEEVLGGMEESILKEVGKDFLTYMLRVRKELMVLRRYYRQMEEMSRELEDDEGGFFTEDEHSDFHLLGDRAGRLEDLAMQQIEYCIEVRELYQGQADRRMNKTMQLLTVLTTTFFPLTLITGWYGMNFEHMPELHSPLGYTAVIAVSVLIVAASIIFWKKKKLF